jgi:site-specific DNA-cytosine methylase
MNTYASIVPLIGGETIAMQNSFQKKPEYILSYEDFKANDTHLVEYYKREVPYYLLGNDRNYDLPSVDVVNTVCPCAGLSSLNTTASSDAAANDWMLTSANYVLGTIKPKVFWGENAPRLASKMGEPVVENLRSIGRKFGYTFSLYKTKSLLHGLGQVRDRSFYFFWKGDKIPKLDFFRRKHERIEDTIRKVKMYHKDPMSVLANKKTPSKNPFYRFVLEEMCGGITHREFQRKITKTVNPMDYIESNNIKYDEVAAWLKSKGFEKESNKATAMYNKLKEGKNIMRRSVTVPKDFIGAFVGHLPFELTHPDEDRHLTIRECLTIMGLPKDFMLQGGVKNLNHICQNVPVTTATDMADNVLKYVKGYLDNQLIDTDFLVQDNKSQENIYEKKPLQLDRFMV